MKEGEDYEVYFDGWTAECLVVVWSSADGRQHASCGEVFSERTKAEVVRKVRRHIRKVHR